MTWGDGDRRQNSAAHIHIPREGCGNAHHLADNLNEQVPSAKMGIIQLGHFSPTLCRYRCIFRIRKERRDLAVLPPKPSRKEIFEKKQPHHLRFVVEHHRRSTGGATPSRGFSWSDHLSTDRFTDERAVDQEAAELARSYLRRVIPVHAHLFNARQRRDGKYFSL